MIVQLTWSDCRELGPSAVKNLAEAWVALGTPAAGAAAERLPFPAMLWINVTATGRTMNSRRTRCTARYRSCVRWRKATSGNGWDWIGSGPCVGEEA